MPLFEPEPLLFFWSDYAIWSFPVGASVQLWFGPMMTTGENRELDSSASG